jgi:hypothetical protein
VDCAVNPKQDVRKIALFNMPSTRGKEHAKARKKQRIPNTVRQIRKTNPDRKSKRGNCLTAPDSPRRLKSTYLNFTSNAQSM